MIIRIIIKLFFMALFCQYTSSNNQQAIHERSDPRTVRIFEPSSRWDKKFGPKVSLGQNDGVGLPHVGGQNIKTPSEYMNTVVFYFNF
jgi:hypothetical protein